jgi:hypothetical protein
MMSGILATGWKKWKTNLIIITGAAPVMGMVVLVNMAHLLVITALVLADSMVVHLLVIMVLVLAARAAVHLLAIMVLVLADRVVVHLLAMVSAARHHSKCHRSSKCSHPSRFLSSR